MLALSSEQWIAVNLVTEGFQPCARKRALLHSGVKVETLETLERMGTLCRWASPDGELWTLSPLAAELLGFELVELVEPHDETRLTCRWQKIGRSLGPVKIPNSWRSLSISDPDALVAPADAEGYLCDEGTGERLLMFGKFPIKVDSKMTRPAGRPRRRRRKAS